MRTGIRRRGMTPLGCLGVALAMFTFVALAAALSGYFFYRNFGPSMLAVRDRIQPIGERFIHLLDEEGFQAAYSMLDENARKKWNEEKFASLTKEIAEKLGKLQSIGVDAQRTVVAITGAPRGEELLTIPIDYVCLYALGEARFKFTFKKADDMWKVSELEVVMEPLKKNRRPAPTPR